MTSHLRHFTNLMNIILDLVLSQPTTAVPGPFSQQSYKNRRTESGLVGGLSFQSLTFTNTLICPLNGEHVYGDDDVTLVPIRHRRAQLSPIPPKT
ncbi:hypothetical protein B0T10DRAFT_317955 [Thelonectria olida]|uniref:Uncharacterized protein n=1 Tax=Thelonectria olida TaxID=1576542 RepID=A0A9P8W8S4_9HYPO|nr:hypothetical protein B0T10DRAFT_317955 [Thelonectria olida]